MSERVGITVRCAACGSAKKPIGRSAPPYMHLCDDDCPGYREAPYAGSLWPGERESEFGFPVGDDGVEVLAQEGASNGE